MSYEKRHIAMFLNIKSKFHVEIYYLQQKVNFYAKKALQLLVGLLRDVSSPTPRFVRP